MFTSDSLQLLNSNALTSLSNGLTAQAQDAMKKAAQLGARASKLSGDYSIQKPGAGRVTVKSETKSGQAASNKAQETAAPIASTSDSMTLLESEGHSIFEEGTDPNPNGTTLADVHELQTQLNTHFPTPDVSEIASKNKNLSAEIKELSAKQSSLLAKGKEAEDAISVINNILAMRASGDLSEPKLNLGALDLPSLTDKQQATVDMYREYVTNRVIKPYKDNKAAFNALKAQLVEKKEEAPLFDLVYGPPISTKGKFILSEDGLYYDSRGGGIPEVVAEQIASNNWNLLYAPNKGGKGVKFGDDDLDTFANTIFSESFTDSSPLVEKLFLNDDILQGLAADRRTHIAELEDQLQAFAEDGYAKSSALVVNWNKSLAAVGASYNDRIKRRKKQLQIAGLFGPFTITDNSFPLGPGYIITPVDTNNPPIGNSVDAGAGNTATNTADSLGPTFLSVNFSGLQQMVIDRIPVNDFSYLRGTGVSPTLEAQESTVLHSGDVNDVILPLVPKYVKSQIEGPCSLGI